MCTLILSLGTDKRCTWIAGSTHTCAVCLKHESICSMPQFIGVEVLPLNLEEHACGICLTSGCACTSWKNTPVLPVSSIKGADVRVHVQELEEHACAVCALPRHAPPDAAHDRAGGAAGPARAPGARPRRPRYAAVDVPGALPAQRRCNLCPTLCQMVYASCKIDKSECSPQLCF